MPDALIIVADKDRGPCSRMVMTPTLTGSTSVVALRDGVFHQVAVHGLGGYADIAPWANAVAHQIAAFDFSSHQSGVTAELGCGL